MKTLEENKVNNIDGEVEEKEYYSDIEEGTAQGGIDEAARSSIQIFLKWSIAFVATTALFTVAILGAISYFNIDYIKVHGQSMEPTFYHSDGIFISTRDEDPQRGDLAVFSEPEEWSTLIRAVFDDNAEVSEAITDGERFFIKRAVAIPGDRIEVSEDGVIINSQEIIDITDKGMTCENDPVDYVLQSDEYFMMGDNIGRSTDAFGLYCQGEDIEKLMVERKSIVYHGQPAFTVSGGWGWFER